MDKDLDLAGASPVQRPVRPLLERLREAGADYTVAWGSGELYDEAADELEEMHVRTLSIINGLLNSHADDRKPLESGG